MRTVSARTLSLCSIVVTVVACAHSANRIPQEGRPTATQIPGSVIRLVTNAPRTTSDDRRLGRAEQIQIRDCMVAKGFRYIVTPPSILFSSRVLQTPNIADRRMRGYHLAEEFAVVGKLGTENDQYVRALPALERDRWTLSFLGDGIGVLQYPNGSTMTYRTGGCIGEARSEIFGSDADWAFANHIGQYHIRKLNMRMQGTAAYRQTMSDWSRCMKGSGRRYAEPADAVQAIQDVYLAKGDTPQVRKQEVETAVMDAKCAVKTQTVERLNAVLVQNLSSLSASAKADLRHVAELRDLALRRVSKLTRRS